MANGDPQTRRLFEQEALPHLDSLFSLACRLTRHEEEAKDLCQETMFRAYRSFHQFEIGTNCRAWLFTILRNTWRTRYSRDQRIQVASSAEGFERAVEAESLKVNADPVTQESISLAWSTGLSVRAALENLPGVFREALVLVSIEKLTYEEASRVLKVPIGTIRSRVSRARSMMRQALERLESPDAPMRAQMKL